MNQPWSVRLLNAAGAWLVQRGWLSDRLTPIAALKAAAIAKAGGLTDFGDGDYEKPLRILHASLETEAGLALFGRWAVEQVRVRVRLRGLSKGFR